jgi:hypothetical protein
MSPRGKRIAASQVGQYAYCARAWWLGVVEGRQPTDLEAIDAGTDLHQRHGWGVFLARIFNKLALVLLGVSCGALLIWAITSFTR